VDLYAACFLLGALFVYSSALKLKVAALSTEMFETSVGLHGFTNQKKTLFIDFIYNKKKLL
jgi:hypothetical protein